MAGHLSAEDCQQVEQYVRQTADMLGLKDWLITVSDEAPVDDSVIAEIRCVNGRKRAAYGLQTTL